MPMGAIGWMITIPITIRFQRVRLRRRRGPASMVLAVVLKHLSFSFARGRSNSAPPRGSGFLVRPGSVLCAIQWPPPANEREWPKQRTVQTPALQGQVQSIDRYAYAIPEFRGS